MKAQWYVSDFLAMSEGDEMINFLNRLNDKGVFPECIKISGHYVYYYHTVEIES